MRANTPWKEAIQREWQQTKRANSILKKAVQTEWRQWLPGLAVMILLISVAAAGYALYSQSPSAKALNELRDHEAATKRNLPLRVDEVTILVDVKFEPNQWSYWYILDGPAEDFDREKLERMTRKNACEVAKVAQRIRLGRLTSEHHYAAKNGVTVAQFKIKTCP
jgi:hypothetical protein